jgi:hypothetical protein
MEAMSQWDSISKRWDEWTPPDACQHGLPGYVFRRRFELLEMEFFKFEVSAGVEAAAAQ